MKTQMGPHGAVTLPKFKHWANKYGTGSQCRGFPVCEGVVKGLLGAIWRAGHASSHDQGQVTEGYLFCERLSSWRSVCVQLAFPALWPLPLLPQWLIW